MKVPNVRGQGGVSINMTPMIDIVFLLIIFFLVSSHLAKQENNVPLDLPLADSGIPVDSEAKSLTINVMTDGSWQVAGRTLQFDELRDLIIERNDQESGRLEVRIRTDATVPYSKIQGLLLACAQAKVGTPVFAVHETKSKS